MPNHCCVPGCRSNYQSTRKNGVRCVSAFSFPSDDTLKSKWIAAIRRHDFIPTKNSSVCVKHFDPSVVITVDRYVKPDGSVLTYNRKNPKLKDGAVPTIFYPPPKSSIELAIEGLKEANKKAKLRYASFDEEKHWQVDESLDVVSKCSVPKCIANTEDGPRVSVFSFPKDNSLKQKWLDAIGRRDFEPSKHNVVCAMHFGKDEMISELSLTRLASGSVPSKFLGPVRYFIKTNNEEEINAHNLTDNLDENAYSAETNSKEIKHENVVDDIDEESADFISIDVPFDISKNLDIPYLLERDIEHPTPVGKAKNVQTCTKQKNAIDNFDILNVPTNWVKVKRSDKIFLFYLEDERELAEVKLKVLLSNSFEVKLYFNDLEIKNLFSNKKVYEFPLKIKNINNLNKILKDSEKLLTLNPGCDYKIQKICQILDDLEKDFNSNKEKQSKVKFLKEQISLLSSSNSPSKRKNPHMTKTVSKKRQKILK